MENEQIRRLGRYELMAELGRGAMGVVYQARDPQIDRMVAIKTVSLAGQELEQEQEFRTRFLCEAQAAGRLNHPGIVTVFDVGETPEDHSPYIVLEFVAGETLNKILARQKKLPLTTALQLAEEIADALDYAHSQGVVHRDIKPANILVTQDWHAKIADFGIAKLNLAHLTVPGKVLGTPAYMAPEQLSGEGVDGRSDIFSLGVILYAMVTGHSPFHGDSATTVCFKVVNRDPVPASAFDLDLPRTLDAVIFRAMAKDPGDRYQRGADFASDLRELRLQYKPGSTTGTSTLSRATTGSFRVSTLSMGSRPVKAKHPLEALIKPPLRDIVLGAALTILLIAFGLPLTQNFLGQKTNEVHVASTTAATHPREAPEPTSEAQPVPQPQVIPHVADAETATASRVVVTPRAPSKSKASRTLEPKVIARDVRTVAPAAQPAKPVIVPMATLDLAIQHQFKEATFTVLVDNHVALTLSLHGGTQKRLVVFKGVKGIDSETLQVPAGAHTLRFRAQTSDQSIDVSKTVSAEFVGGDVKNLQITFDRHDSTMKLAWQ